MKTLKRLAASTALGLAMTVGAAQTAMAAVYYCTWSYSVYTRDGAIHVYDCVQIA